MKRISVCTHLFLGLLTLGTCASVWAQGTADKQCSLAIVSRAVGGNKSVCDSAQVALMAGRGQAFAENQMGISSVLAIVRHAGFFFSAVTLPLGGLAIRSINAARASYARCISGKYLC